MTIGASITKLMVVDDHPAMREGLCTLIDKQPDLRVVAQAADGQEAISQFRFHRPALILMDLQMPGLDGLDAAGIILSESPLTFIVALTSYDGDARVARALSVGVRSYLLKTAHPSVVVDSLRRVLRGEIVVEPALTQLHVPSGDHLTGREISVLKLVAQGNQNRDIGVYLKVSEHTVKARIKSILSKLGAKDRAHAVTLARGRGFLDF